MNQKYITFLKQYPKIFRITRATYTYGYLKLKKIEKTPKRIIFRITKNKNIIEKLLLDYPMILSGMVSENHMRIILTNLKKVLDDNVEGDIVELGCNAGTTSLFIQKLLDYYRTNKKFHVYDSFEGLPEKDNKDKSNTEYQYEKGSCKKEKEVLINNFKLAKLKLPKIHTGWFGEIPNEEYPEKIAFAFFDGDFYTSILDSFNKVYPKMVTNSRIAIHDYQWKFLPGVEKACTNFLKDKPEKGTITNNDHIGIMIKK
ncbi:MAG: TylF/MycF/NovP-related O-methyltransferase [archaeon]